MPYTFYDDAAGPAQWSPPECWQHHANSTGANGLVRWNDGTYSEPALAGGQGNLTTRCEMKIPFYGTFAAIYGSNYGEYTGAVFHCHLEYKTTWGETVREGVWDWRDSTGSRLGGTSNSGSLCAVTSIPAGNHTLVLGIEPDQVGKGLSIDQYQVSSDVNEGMSVEWSSDFTAIVPPETFRNTTASALIPSRTGFPSATASSSSSSSSDSSNRLGLGLGVGLGVAALALAFLVGLWCVRSRRAARRAVEDERRLSLDTKGNWYPLNQGGKGSWVAFGRGTSTGPPTPVEEEAVKERDLDSPVLPLHSTYDSNAAHPGSFFSSSTLPHSPVGSTAGHAGSFFPLPAVATPPPLPDHPPERVWQDLPRDAELEDPSAFRARM
ncbi:hypothetical protein JCM6882_002307 [Rhodosporidiobolus microsporus]